MISTATGGRGHGHDGTSPWGWELVSPPRASREAPAVGGGGGA
jgi:hypothetical protein